MRAAVARRERGIGPRVWLAMARELYASRELIWQFFLRNFSSLLARYGSPTSSRQARCGAVGGSRGAGRLTTLDVEAACA